MGLLLLPMAFVLDGRPEQPPIGGDWRFVLQAPVLLVYTLLMYRTVTGGEQRVLLSRAIFIRNSVRPTLKQLRRCDSQDESEYYSDLFLDSCS